MKKKEELQTIKISKPWIVVAIIAVALVIILFLIPKDTAVASVNNQKIYEKRVDAIYNSLPTGQKLDKNQILQKLIDTKVLVDYIEKHGLNMTDAQFNQQLALQLNASKITLDELEADLTMRGATLGDVKDSMLIEIFVNRVVTPMINVTSSAISSYRTQTNSTNMTDADIKQQIVVKAQTDILSQIIGEQTKSENIAVYKKY